MAANLKSYRRGQAAPATEAELRRFINRELDQISNSIGEMIRQVIDNSQPDQHLFYGPYHTDVSTVNTLVTGSAPVYNAATGKWEADNLFSVAAYGGINIATPVAFDVTTAWQTLPLDTGLLNTPRGIVQDPANNAIQFGYEGVYKIDIGGIIQGHNSLSSGRTFFVRLFNNTEGVPLSSDLAIGVGRNTEDTNYGFGTLLEVPATAVNDSVVVQIGGGDNITGGTLTAGELSAFMVSEVRTTTTLDTLFRITGDADQRITGDGDTRVIVEAA